MCSFHAHKYTKDTLPIPNDDRVKIELMLGDLLRHLGTLELGLTSAIYVSKQILVKQLKTKVLRRMVVPSLHAIIHLLVCGLCVVMKF